jgi:hypothetical protein
MPNGIQWGHLAITTMLLDHMMAANGIHKCMLIKHRYMLIIHWMRMTKYIFIIQVTGFHINITQVYTNMQIIVL